ncbi:putative disease resistance protein [Nymphaea thermarum]|nr:putative disease resistance protein [Nymphaea thermarum]
MTKGIWESVEKSEIWDWKMPASPSSEIYGSILPGLMLSYDDLPTYLKSCFTYCCIYPKDYEIQKGSLVKQWVAHGLIDQNNDIDVEVTANQWIDDLIKRFMIEETDDKDLKLHDILHDLASYIGGKVYRHAYATEYTRHLSLLGVDDAEAAMQCNATGAANKVRTILWSKYLSSVEFTNCKWLRVLSLRGCRMYKLPNSIEFLPLLKYLDLSKSNVRRLPSSIGKLHNLQTLDLTYSKIRELPKEMGELCNLRYLGLEKTWNLQFMAEGLGKLTNLRTLHRILVCDDKDERRGCNIREIENLNKLKGELLVEGLGGGRVKVIDAEKAQLNKKHELIGVELNFEVGEDDEVDSASEDSASEVGEDDEVDSASEDSASEVGEDDEVDSASEDSASEVGEDDEVDIASEDSASEVGEDDEVDSASEQRGLLEALEPPHGIERLKICDYVGDRPAWYLETNYEELRALQLRRIKSLKKLKVNGCNGLKTLANMPALEWSEVIDCGSLEQVAEMPLLRSLEVSGCNMMKTLANMPTLESLKVRDCGSLAEMPALMSLEVRICSMLKTLANMPALESLDLSPCGSLEQVGDDHMPALKELTLYRLNALTQLPTSLPSLEVLGMQNLANWEGWPEAASGKTTLTSMPCLREAEFRNCPKMRTEGWIDELMGDDSQATQLQKLTVRDCPNARLGRKWLQHLSNLIELRLDTTALESTLLPSEVSTFLPSLKLLSLKGTNTGDLKWGKVPDWVWGLSQLETLFLKGFTEDNSLGGHWQCLRKLKTLWLEDFPNLKSLVDVNNISLHPNETTSPTDAQQQIACLSKLEDLRTYKCPKVE